jgi:beta-N-acetylhexosaminidase
MSEPRTGRRYQGQQPTRRVVLGAVAGLGLAGLPRMPARRIGPRAAAALSNLQLAGQRVISSYSGLTPPQSLFNDITAGQTAGVIFFGGNISSDTQIAGVITQLRQNECIGAPVADWLTGW